MVKGTVQEVNCAPQRLLRREGEVDLKERRGHNINTAPITLTHGDYKIQTCTNTTLPPDILYSQSTRSTTSLKANVLQTLEKHIYPALHRSKARHLFGSL